MDRICLTDNNQGCVGNCRFKRTDIAPLFPYAGKTIETLCHENDGLLVVPPTTKDTKDDVEKSVMLDIVSTENPDDVCLRTGNVMGFVGVGDLKIKIRSRFDTGDDDYLLHYMLQRVLSFNLFDLDYTNDDDAVFDFMMLMFPSFLKSALAQGIYREYQRRCYNDSRMKGFVDVARHISRNTPFGGNVAYSMREYTHDNSMTQLIRHTIEFMHQKRIGNAVLNRDKETIDNVRQIVECTPTYNKAERNRIVQKSLRPNRHPYFTAYRPLQRLCVQILRMNDMKYGENDDELSGILFDGAWLWEEYVDTILQGYGFKHPQNRLKKGMVPLFDDNSGPRYPDFYNTDIVLDAKYKRMEKMDKVSEVNRDDLHQLIAYIDMLRLKHGGFVAPMTQCQTVVPTSRLNGANSATISIYGIEVAKADCYKDFCKGMVMAEKRFVQAVLQ